MQAAPCQADLDAAIAVAADSAATTYERETVKFYAQHLTARELDAAIEFVKSSAGRAILRVGDETTDDAARIGHEMSAGAWAQVSHHFCPTHPEVCRARDKTGKPFLPALQ